MASSGTFALPGRLTSIVLQYVIVISFFGLARAQISGTCQAEGSTSFVCTIRNWTASALGSGSSNFVLDISPQSNSVEVKVRAECTGKFAQTFARVSKSGYDTCNATVNPDGKKYVNQGIPGTDEVVIPTCYIVQTSSATVTGNSPVFSYQDNLQDIYYIIGTVDGTAVQSNQYSAVTNTVGGACSQGLKAMIVINWIPVTTPAAPTTTTVQTTTTIVQATSPSTSAMISDAITATPDVQGVIGATTSSLLCQSLWPPLAYLYVLCSILFN